MVAKAKAVSHGINLLNYISGVSKNKKYPEKISRICDNLIPSYMDALGIWNRIQLISLSNPRLTNNVIRIEISPSPKYTKDFTKEDWQKLWNDFVYEFDRKEIKDKNGSILSPKTNIANSIYTVWLHQESKSGIPHIHAAVSRIDEEGNMNNDSNIHLRAQRAAEKVARKYGWTTANEKRENATKEVEKDCLDVLKSMDSWNLDNYFRALKDEKGYDVRIRADRKGKVCGYVLRRDNCKYKASEIGIGRKLLVSILERTWNDLHPVQTPELKNAGLSKDDIESKFDYTKPKDGTRKVEFSYDGENYIRYIPEQVVNFFEDEFDYREIINWKELLAESYFHFSVWQGIIAMLNTTDYHYSGGGGSDNDLPRRKDELEEEMKFAIRCANAAKAKIGIVKRKGLRR